MRWLHYIETCTSTNDVIDQYLPLITKLDFFAIYTLDQTKGRGQYGNQWISAAYKNLAYSLAVPESYVKSSDSLFNFYTAIIIRDFIAGLTNCDTKIKWPNDIILNKKKIGGILIEKKKIQNDWYYIIGFGLNVLQKNFSNITQAGSILTQTEIEYSPVTIAQELHQTLISRIKLYPYKGIIERFNDLLFRKDVISVVEIGNERQNGIIRHADENGKLWIELTNGLQSFSHKEVKLLY